jgi:hypothetical protein
MWWGYYLIFLCLSCNRMTYLYMLDMMVGQVFCLEVWIYLPFLHFEQCVIKAARASNLTNF